VVNELLPAKFVVEWANGETELISVQFNPTEMSFTKGTQIAEVAIPGLDAPIQQFVRGQAEKLNLELFFDTTDTGMDAGAISVTTLTDSFYRLVKIESKTHAPPVCEFQWHTSEFPGLHVPALGSHHANQARHGFRCVVESLTQKFTLFSPQGIPLRATLSLTLREYKTLEDQLTELGLQSADHTRSYVVRQGDTLSGIAARMYGSPAEWPRLADHNRITDPRRITPGAVLEVPPV
jgi:nucleoid-associated protein YgaU